MCVRVHCIKLHQIHAHTRPYPCKHTCIHTQTCTLTTTMYMHIRRQTIQICQQWCLTANNTHLRYGQKYMYATASHAQAWQYIPQPHMHHVSVNHMHTNLYSETVPNTYESKGSGVWKTRGLHVRPKYMYFQVPTCWNTQQMYKSSWRTHRLDQYDQLWEASLCIKRGIANPPHTMCLLRPLTCYYQKFLSHLSVAFTVNRFHGWASLGRIETR